MGNRSHVLLTNPRLNGWQYGMLRELEDAIVAETGARIVSTPDSPMPMVTKRAAHGTRWQQLRKAIPKRAFDVDADVLWYVLMGPEDFDLDLFTGWEKVPCRIVYFFDTLEPQFPLIQDLFSRDFFNVHITSFNDAVPFLSQLTGKKWHVVEQAASKSVFELPPLHQKLISFSSYGRRHQPVHEALLEFSQEQGLYYDFTTHDALHPTAPARQLYRQFAWHMNHSLFTICWPVETTNPVRAGRLSPITCRWYEAMAGGAIMLGQAPRNNSFHSLFGEDAVIPIDAHQEKGEIKRQLKKVWEDREKILEKYIQIRQRLEPTLFWNERVKRMLHLLETDIAKSN